MNELVERMEARSLALHAEVARRLDTELVAMAQRRVQTWSETGKVAQVYAEGWRALLARPIEEIRAALVRRDETMAALRQVSPFAGAIPSRERWAILRRVRDEAQ